MPELPEVETIKNDLSKKLLNKKIKEVVVKKPKLVNGGVKKFKEILSGNKFKKINRRGKLIYIELYTSGFLLIHLKMTGQLIYSFRDKLVAGGHSLKAGNIEGKFPNKSTRVYFTFSDWSRLFFNDQRRFGYLKIVADDNLIKIKQKYGIEPLAANFTLKNFFKITAGRTKNIKALLLDQSLISGLGNIYVDESLFAAGIRPSRRANGLTRGEIERLYSAIEALIRKAIKYRGTTFNNYRDAQGKKGNFVSKLQVYGRDKERCLKCGNIIKKIKIAGRGTHYCPHCQK